MLICLYKCGVFCLNLCFLFSRSQQRSAETSRVPPWAITAERRVIPSLHRSDRWRTEVRRQQDALWICPSDSPEIVFEPFLCFIFSDQPESKKMASDRDNASALCMAFFAFFFFHSCKHTETLSAKQLKANVCVFLEQWFYPFLIHSYRSPAGCPFPAEVRRSSCALWSEPLPQIASSEFLKPISDLSVWEGKNNYTGLYN